MLNNSRAVVKWVLGNLIVGILAHEIIFREYLSGEVGHNHSLRTTPNLGHRIRNNERCQGAITPERIIPNLDYLQDDDVLHIILIRQQMKPSTLFPTYKFCRNKK